MQDFIMGGGGKCFITQSYSMRTAAWSHLMTLIFCRGVQCPHQVVWQCGAPEQCQEDSQDALTPLLCGCNPIRGGLQAVDDRTGPQLPVPKTATDALHGLYSGPSCGVACGTLTDAAWSWLGRSAEYPLRENRRRIGFHSGARWYCGTDHLRGARGGQ